jgi:phospholipid/cholesterol/gamma-HCH transport system substrate-binding protein
MSKDRNSLKAGLFIVFSFVATVAVIVLIRGAGMGPAQTRTVAFRLSDDLGGLDIGDDVRVGGVKVGIIRDIKLVDLDSANPRVLVKFSIPASYTLRQEAIIGVQSALTGPTNLNITNLGTGSPLADGAEMAGAPDPKHVLWASLGRTAPRVESIAQNIETQTVPKVNETIDSAKTLVRHVDAKIDPAVEKYNGVATHAGEMMTEVRDLVGDTKTDFRGTVKNLNQATASVREKLPTLLDKIQAIEDKVDGALVSARSALEDVQKTVANAKDISGSARGIIVGNKSKFDNIIASLKTTSDNLKGASVEIRRSPWRLLYKPTASEMGNLNLYDSARQFAEGAGSLSDAATALRDALHDPNADKAQIQKLVTHLDESFNNFHQVENKLWTAVKE